MGEIIMKKITKILIGISLILLLIGTVSAFDRDSLKPIDDCNAFKEGSSVYKTYDAREFYVEKLYTPDVYFENTADYKVEPKENNTFYFEDVAFDLYGYQEAVELDGETYYISVYQHSKLSPSEEKELFEDLLEFNKINKLEPIEMSVT